MNKGFFSGKRVLVMGLGRFGGGVDVARFAHEVGAKVTVTDLASAQQLGDSIKQLEELEDIGFHLGSHDSADFELSDIIIANPAVPADDQFLELARRANRFITSQISIFFELCPAPIIGITGANGKSTTAALTAHLLKRMRGERRGTEDENVWLSGNIGNRPLLTTIDQISPDDLVVLELSSFQLEQLAKIQKAPKVALLTNLTPNHLDRHGTFANYCAAKENIFKFQKLSADSPAVSIFNVEDDIAAEWFERYKNETGRICVKFSTDDVSEGIRSIFPLPGRANLSNLAAAITIAGYFGIGDEQIKSCLPGFRALPHRLEFVEQMNGVRWYNDSIATTPQSTIAALEAFEQPVIIIAGGYDKNLPFDELGEKIVERAKAAILIGQTAPKIRSSILDARYSMNSQREFRIEIVHSLVKAVELAHHLAVPGDIVLLSPACASYDMFDNFEYRGREFINLLKSLDRKKVRVETERA